MYALWQKPESAPNQSRLGALTHVWGAQGVAARPAFLGVAVPVGLMGHREHQSPPRGPPALPVLGGALGTLMGVPVEM